VKNVRIRLRDPSQWRSVEGLHVRGSAFCKGPGTALAPLTETFGQVQSLDDFIEKLNQLNGFFSIIREDEQAVFASVGPSRSFPLFYGQKGTTVYLSDDAYWVRDQVGDTEFDDLAETEFALCGYVTGPDTLYPHVKQLQTAEGLMVSNSSEGPIITTTRYFRRFFRNPFAIGEEELCQLHEELLEQAIRRLITWADGRCLCLPLSAGRDSRLIALMLRRLGYDNVVAFSYGKPGNLEATVSRQVAQTLGFRWHFVPYSHEAWRAWFRSPERWAYYRFADGLCSLPHIQDWPAVWEIRKARIIPDDAVFIPGHASTRLRPRHLRWTKRIPAEEQLVKLIWRRHYALSPWDPKQGDLGRRLRQRVLHRAEAPKLETFLDVESAAEKWIWQERNSKFIINSVRAYEFWGYQWWLPLMDLELINFWSKVPVQYRVDRLGYLLLYEAHVDQLWARASGLAEKASGTYVGGIVWPIRQLLYQAQMTPRLRRVIYLLKRRSGEYDRHHLAWYGVMPRSLFQQLYTGREEFNWFLVQEWLGRLSLETNPKDAKPATTGTTSWRKAPSELALM
jgi:asparagine synthase (glutamine-hydrolysing)